MDTKLVEAKVAAVKASNVLKEGYTIAIANRDIHGNVQVEVRADDGCLCWRAWNYEGDFEWWMDKAIDNATKR